MTADPSYAAPEAFPDEGRIVSIRPLWRTFALVVLAALLAGFVISLYVVRQVNERLQKSEPDNAHLTFQEQQLLELLNKARAEAKLPPLQAEPILQGVARSYVKLMAKQQVQDDELDGLDTPRRVRKAGYVIVGEEVTANMTAAHQMQPAAAAKIWLDVSVAKENIVNANYIHAGIGSARDGNGQVYYYLILATPAK